MTTLARRFSRYGVLLVMVSMLLALGSPASAATGNKGAPAGNAAGVASILQGLSDGGTSWSDLTPEQQKQVMETLSTATVSTEVVDSGSAPKLDGASPEACRWARIYRYYNNALGQRLFTYYQQVDWCYNGSTITSISRTRWPEVSMLFWEFKGHIGNTTSGGTGSTFYRAWTQGSFALCVPYVLCAQFKYPWLDMTVRGNGTYSYSTGG